MTLVHPSKSAPDTGDSVKDLGRNDKLISARNEMSRAFTALERASLNISDRAKNFALCAAEYHAMRALEIIRREKR